MYILETSGLTKVYNTNVALNNVDMHIEKGDIYGFVGENGAGKTTIIRIISGLAKPTKGSYKLFGIENNNKEIETAKKKLGGIVESVSLNPTISAKKNLKIQSLVVGKKLTNEDFDDLLKRVGLNPLAIENKNVGSFSLGMRQRLGIAMILLSNPEFIILDEPMNGLDPKGFIEVRDIIKKLNEEGITFLISSHILSELDKICTRVGFISHGKMIKELSIDELHDQSKSKIIIEADNLEELNNKLLEKLEIKNTKIKGKDLYIYDSIDINDVMKFLVEENIKIKNISRVEEALENYYMKLIGGAKND